jgi:hypothetical protein
MKKLSWLIPIILFMACRNNDGPSNIPVSSVPSSAQGYLVADTIIYDVIIKNTNPDDEWTEHSLKNLNRSFLIDSILELAYSGRAQAFEYFTNELLDPKELRKLEQEREFSRESIGKIQFEERWYYSGTPPALHKEVLSMVLGYELFADSGEFRGYKPLFRIVL